MKSIETLIPDIYALFGSRKEFDEEISKLYGASMARMVSSRVPSGGYDPLLRMSNAGTPCERKLWYSVNVPAEEQEPFPSQVRFKFLYGDILEELVLFLAAEAGHKVEGMQDELDIGGVKGHRDAVIDGMVVDVKSTTSFGLQDFKNHLVQARDKFGYITQLQLYLWASQDDPKVTIKDKAAFLAIDKTTGEMALDIQEKDYYNYEKVIEHKKKVISGELPPRLYKDQSDGMSGNMTLGVACSYCSFKKKCWPGLRTFLYSSKPRYLTKVVKVPLVPELKD